MLEAYPIDPYGRLMIIEREDYDTIKGYEVIKNKSLSVHVDESFEDIVFDVALGEYTIFHDGSHIFDVWLAANSLNVAMLEYLDPVNIDDFSVGMNVHDNVFVSILSDDKLWLHYIVYPSNEVVGRFEVLKLHRSVINKLGGRPNYLRFVRRVPIAIRTFDNGVRMLPLLPIRWDDTGILLPLTNPTSITFDKLLNVSFNDSYILFHYEQDGFECGALAYLNKGKISVRELFFDLINYPSIVVLNAVEDSFSRVVMTGHSISVGFYKIGKRNRSERDNLNVYFNGALNVNWNVNSKDLFVSYMYNYVALSLNDEILVFDESRKRGLPSVITLSDLNKSVLIRPDPLKTVEKMRRFLKDGSG